jgi:hypothetical protein
MSMKIAAQQSRRLMLSGLVLLLFACSQFEAGYFQSKVDQVTRDVVASRYGTPHKVDELPDGGTVWTYFDRGSGTAGFGNYAPSSHCKAYVLTFDESQVLRDWKQQDCT